VEQTEERHFTTADAARYCSLTYHSIIYNVGKGKLNPSFRTGSGEPMFSKTELDRFNAARKPGWESEQLAS
jgi:hypothetical protein